MLIAATLLDWLDSSLQSIVTLGLAIERGVEVLRHRPSCPNGVRGAAAALGMSHLWANSTHLQDSLAAAT